jgi:undecaprenyl-diphosphatase
VILVPWLFSWKDPGLTFDVALHAGTLVAVITYFWKDWLLMIKQGLTAAQSREGRLCWYLVVATVPGAAAGFLLEKKAETIQVTATYSMHADHHGHYFILGG